MCPLICMLNNNKKKRSNKSSSYCLGKAECCYISVPVQCFRAPTSEGGNEIWWYPAGWLEQPVSLKIKLQDLYYGKVETVIASKSSLPLWDREKARRNHLHCTSCFISVPSHYSIFYFLSFLCPAKLTFERVWIGSKAVLNKWDCFSYWLRWSFD